MSDHDLSKQLPMIQPIIEAEQIKKDEPLWIGPFLTALARTGNVTMSARAAGISRRTANEYRRHNAAFALVWQDAMDEATDLLEAEMQRRAVEGVVEPVYGRRYEVVNGRSVQVSDGKVGEIRKYSDTLLIFALKGNRPEKYKDSHEQAHSGEIQIRYVNDWRGGDPSEGPAEG